MQLHISIHHVNRFDRFEDLFVRKTTLSATFQGQSGALEEGLGGDGGEGSTR